MTPRWVMIDIETLDTELTAVVVSIAAVRFDENTDPIDKLAILLDMEDQQLRGRTISPQTLSWWMTQSDEARRWNFNESNRYPIDTALQTLSAFCANATLFWSRGSFDPNILENLYHQFYTDVPWKYSQLRDVRSFDELWTGGPCRVGLVDHLPLDDCFKQVDQVRDVFRQLTPQPAVIVSGHSDAISDLNLQHLTTPDDAFMASKAAFTSDAELAVDLATAEVDAVEPAVTLEEEIAEAKAANYGNDYEREDQETERVERERNWPRTPDPASDLIF